LKSLLAIVLGTTLLTTSDQTIWWHTDGAAVIEFHETNECAMFLYDNMRAVIISWGKNNETIGIEDDSLQLTQGVAVPIAVQIGTTWIGDPNIPDLTAYGSGHDLAVPLDPSLLSIAKDKWMPFFDHLIVGADHITFKMPDTEITYETPRPKLPALVAAVDKCRKMISR
jgi:hypothetical protein